MSSNDRADAVSVNKLWYDNLYPKGVKTVQTYLDRTDKRRFTIDMRGRHDSPQITLTVNPLSQVFKNIQDSHTCVINPTLFDKSNLRYWDYELAIQSYYCSVVEEFGMDDIQYRYDTNLPVHYESMRSDIVTDALSYRAYSDTDPNIGDTVLRVSRAYVIPAKYDVDTLILLEWNVSTAGTVIHSILDAYMNVIKQNGGLYKDIIFVFENNSTFNLYKEKFNGAVIMW